MLEHLIGQRLNQYQATRLLSEDRVATYFLARDTNLQRDIAIQVIHPAIANQPGFEQLFNQLARAAAQLDHPGIIRIFDFGKSQSYSYIVTEHIPGAHLGELLKDLRDSGRWISLAEAVELVRQVALAVDYLRNQNGLQPRLLPEKVELKPGQGDLLPYRPVFTDAGLVEQLEAQFIDSGEVLPEMLDYLPPEKAAGRGGDARSDVYSLGILLFELTTGQTPFPIETLADAVRYHIRQPPPGPRSLRPDMPESLENVILRALEKNPAIRYPNPGALARDLQTILPSVIELKTPPPAFERVTNLLDPYRKSLGREQEPVIEAPAKTQAQPAPRSQERGQLQVVIENSQLSMEPGSSASTKVYLNNQSDAAGYFRLNVSGVPDSWISLSSPVLQLGPGEQQVVTLTIHPPRTPQTRAGRYPLTLRVSSQPASEQVVEAQMTLSVGAFSRFTSRISPQVLNPGEVGSVNIENQGNTPETFTINFGDREGALVFTPPQAQLRLVEGQSGTAEFKPGLRQPRWIGSLREHPFLAQVLSATGETQTHGGQYISRPLVPVWVLGVLLFLCLCSAGLLAFYFNREGLQVTQATATILAAQTETAAMQETFVAGTATATFLVGANEETLQAVTATAQAQGATSTALANLEASATAQAATATVQAIQTATGQAQAATATIQANQTATAAAATLAAEDAQAVTTTFQANQTATAAAATLAAEDAQAATATFQANQTATAQANINLTATAQVATQTAQVTTPPPPSGRRLAYIYSIDTDTAGDYEEFLEDRGFTVDLILQDAVEATDYSPYQGILLGPDTGNEGVFLGQDGELADFVNGLNLPVLGLEEGGASFFGQLDFPIGWDAAVPGEGTQVFAIDPGNGIWSDPNQITIPGDQILGLYGNTSEQVAINLDPPPGDVTTFASQPEEPAQILILRYQERYFYWGFEDGPDEMTNTGRQLFENFVNIMAPEE